MTEGIDDEHYRSSSFSGGGNCVQAQQLENGDVCMRDSRNPAVSIVVSHADWVAFVAGVKNSEFDFPSRFADRD